MSTNNKFDPNDPKQVENWLSTLPPTVATGIREAMTKMQTLDRKRDAKFAKLKKLATTLLSGLVLIQKQAQKDRNKKIFDIAEKTLDKTLIITKTVYDR